MQWLRVISANTDRHVAQIQELKGESSYRANKFLIPVDRDAASVAQPVLR